MDINDRDANFEKQEKTFTHLRESWKNISSGKQQVLTESKAKDGFAAGKALKSKQKVKPMTEEVPTEVKKDEVIPAPEETPAPVSVDAPEVPPVDGTSLPPVDGAEVPPADGTSLPPVDGAEVPPAETGLQPNPEKQVATQQFVQSALKGVTSGDADNKTLVTEFGFFKADVSDPANGQYVVIAYPADMKLKDIASVVEPVETPAEVAAAGDAEADEAGKVEPAPEGSPEDAASDLGGDAATDLGGTPEDAASTDETKPEDDEMLKESARDPISVGKKNWSSYLRKLLNEGTILEESKKEEKGEKEEKEEKKDVKEVCEEKEEKKEDVKELKEEEKEVETPEVEKEEGETEEKGETPEVEKEEGETEEAKPEDLAAKKAQDAVLKEKLAEVKRLDVRVKSIQEQIKSIKTEYFEDEKIRQEMVEAYTKALAVANGALVSLKNSIEMMKS
jgi:hypothetical protein